MSYLTPLGSFEKRLLRKAALAVAVLDKTPSVRNLPLRWPVNLSTRDLPRIQSRDNCVTITGKRRGSLKLARKAADGVFGHHTWLAQDVVEFADGMFAIIAAHLTHFIEQRLFFLLGRA